MKRYVSSLRHFAGVLSVSTLRHGKISYCLISPSITRCPHNVTILYDRSDSVYIARNKKKEKDNSLVDLLILRNARLFLTEKCLWRYHARSRSRTSEIHDTICRTCATCVIEMLKSLWKEKRKRNLLLLSSPFLYGERIQIYLVRLFTCVKKIFSALIVHISI